MRWNITVTQASPSKCMYKCIYVECIESEHNNDQNRPSTWITITRKRLNFKWKDKRKKYWNSKSWNLFVHSLAFSESSTRFWWLFYPEKKKWNKTGMSQRWTVYPGSHCSTDEGDLLQLGTVVSQHWSASFTLSCTRHHVTWTGWYLLKHK